MNLLNNFHILRFKYIMKFYSVPSQLPPRPLEIFSYRLIESPGTACRLTGHMWAN